MNKPIRSSMMQSLDGGKLIAVVAVEAGWRLTFENEIAIESYSGWRAFEPGNPSKTLLGSRDLDSADAPLKDVLKVIGDSVFTTLYFDFLRDGLGLGLEDSSRDRLIRLEMFKTSVKRENWRIIGEDFIDSDRDELIVNMNWIDNDT